jgi:hypothetical protein
MADPAKVADKGTDSRLAGGAFRATGAGPEPGGSPADASWVTLKERAELPQRRQSVGGWRSQTSGRVGNREVIIVEGTVGPQLPESERFPPGKLEKTLEGEHGIHAWGLQLGENLPEAIRSGPGRALNLSLLKRIENDLRRVADQAEEIGAVVEARATLMIEYQRHGKDEVPVIVAVQREAELRPVGPGKDPIRLVDFSATVDPITREVNYREAPGTGGRARLTDARLAGRPPRSGDDNPRLTGARLSASEREPPADTPPTPPRSGGTELARGSTPRAPAGAGTARGGGALAIALVIMEFAAIYADYLQGKEAQAALENQKRQISDFLRQHPEYGALIVINFKQQVSNPSGEASLHAPPPRFHSVMAYYGTTYAEAYSAWKVSRDLDEFDRRYFVESHDTRWIPPAAPRSGKQASQKTQQSTTALVRDLQAYLKPPPSYGAAFHALNGCEMKQMLQALNALKQSGRLAQLDANFDRAEGVNRGRIRVAIRATQYRGTSDAYAIFVSDEALRSDLAGVEPEGQAAIQRVLLQNRDD